MDMLAIFVAGAVLGFLPLYWIVSRRSPPAKPQASGKVFSLFKQEEKPRLFETLAASDDWVVIDLETTGIKRSSEIIEVSIIAADGTVLFESTVLPQGSIPRNADGDQGLCDLTAAQRFPGVSQFVHDRPHQFLRSKTHTRRGRELSRLA